jgi:CopG family transcriptional regulator/antitoxin EndoAI
MCPAYMQRIMVTIPDSLLMQIEEATTRANLNRSQFIRQAIKHYLEEQHRQELRALLQEGYLAHAAESQELAAAFFAAEQEATERYVPWEEDNGA